VWQESSRAVFLHRCKKEFMTLHPLRPRFFINEQDDSMVKSRPSKRRDFENKDLCQLAQE
jgi:hypothetical protein